MYGYIKINTIVPRVADVTIPTHAIVNKHGTIFLKVGAKKL